MRIYIPSYKRPDTQPTFNQLRGVKGADTYVVVAPEEAQDYCRSIPGTALITLPKGVQGNIGRVRQWIAKHHAQHSGSDAFVMMDDDLVFSTRRTDDPTKAAPATKADLASMLKSMGNILKHFTHVGILAREGANRFADDGMLENTRMMRVLGYNVQRLMEVDVKFDRVELMEDFDVTLQLLRKGQKNYVLCDWWHNQAGSNKDGGCSVTRTMEAHAAAAHKLAELHPGFVQVVEKVTKTAWGGGTRTDVKIAWKKAFASSGAK